MGKDKESYLKSRDERRRMFNYYGFIPLSVLSDISNKSDGYYIYQEEKKAGTNQIIRPSCENIEKTPFNASGFGSRGGERYTVMPPKLVEFCIKYYAKEGDLYLDPFAGQGIQMQVAKRFNIDYIGFDICGKFMRFNKAIKEKIDDGKSKIELFHDDARNIDNKRCQDWNFCFTSPPYWNIEHYDDNPAQLGVKKTYKEFLDGMLDVYKRMHETAAKGATAIINVNDFRINKVFYAYHNDTVQLLKEAGFKIHDIAILNEVVSGLAKSFAVSLNKQKILPKIHEYLIIAKHGS